MKALEDRKYLCGKLRLKANTVVFKSQFMKAADVPRPMKSPVNFLRRRMTVGYLYNAPMFRKFQGVCYQV
jgi:hypothetical protein